MTDQYVAEIRIFGFNFAPVGWAFCDGQILPISQYTALFSLLGTNFGGDGRSNFGLPNFQGSVPLNAGQGPGLSPYDVGQSGGTGTVTVLSTEMPTHNHGFVATSANGTTTSAGGSQLARGLGGSKTAASVVNIYSTSATTTSLNPQALSVTGGGQPHNNLMPYLTLNFCIAMQGVFPPRS